MKEGDRFEPVKHVATVRGKARLLLLGERVALNVLARCSGIATKSVDWYSILRQQLMICTRSRRFKDLAQIHGFKGLIAGTRKTTPGNAS